MHDLVSHDLDLDLDLVSHVRTFLTGIQVVCYRLNCVVGVLNRNRCRREELNVLAHEPFVAGNAGVGGWRTAEYLKATRRLSWTAGCLARWAPVGMLEDAADARR